jgi:hypothetical protein
MAFEKGKGMIPAPGGGLASQSSSSLLASVDKIRNVFPETWLWSNSLIG